MKLFITFITALFLVLFSYYALAETKTITWIPPTEYVDNTPISPEDLEQFRVYCNGNAPILVAPDQTSVSVDFLPGTYTCHVTASAHGKESAPSVAATVIIDWPFTKAPTGVTIT